MIRFGKKVHIVQGNNVKDNKYNNLLFFMISGPDLKYLLNKNGMNNVLVEVTRGMSAKNPRENPPKNKRKSYPKWPKTRGAANKRLKS